MLYIINRDVTAWVKDEDGEFALGLRRLLCSHMDNTAWRTLKMGAGTVSAPRDGALYVQLGY